VGEGIEGGFAAVRALSGIAYAAEGEGWDGAVEEGVVDGGTAGCYFVEDCGILVCGLKGRWK
jgi:hypothetical protein